MIKKLLSHDNHEICAQFDPSNGLVTLGGSRQHRETIWRLYIVAFKECDGEPDFHEVTRGKARLNFKTNMKGWQNAMAELSDEDYDIYDVQTFERKM